MGCDSMVCRVNQRLFDEHGHCWPVADARQAYYKKPVRLIWQVNDGLHSVIVKAVASNQQVCNAPVFLHVTCTLI